MVEEDGARIRDLSSRNGTFVNGDRVDGERSLQDGDLICVAACVFEVQLSPNSRLAWNAVWNVITKGARS